MKKLFVLILVLCLTLTLASCDLFSGNSTTNPPSGGTTTPPAGGEVNKVIQSIVIDQLPATLYYEQGDEPEWNGIVIKAIYDDESIDIIPFVDCTFSDVDTTTTGEKEVTVTYEGVSTKFVIYVAHTVSFNPGSDAEADYFFESSGVSNVNNESGDRYADETGYFTYKVKLESGKKFDTAILDVIIRNEYKISISFDNITYYELASSVARVDFVPANWDIADFINEFANNTGTMYIKFEDSVPTDGFGASLKEFNLYYTTVDYEGPAGDEPEKVEISFTPATYDEAPYLHEEHGSGTAAGTKRWADENNYFVYKLTLGESIVTARLNIVIENQGKVEISLDGTAWTQVANAVEENANGEGKYYSNVTKTIDITPYLTGNEGTIYVRFSDADTTNGFGGALYSFAVDAMVVEPVEIHNHTVVILQAVPATCTSKGLTEGKKCSDCGETLVAQKETDMLEHNWEWIVDKEATNTETGLKHQECKDCDAVQANNTEIPALKPEETLEVVDTTITFVPTTADEAPYLHSEAGSGNGGTHRWADGNAYFVYKFTLGEEIRSATLNLTVQNDTKIEISLDGSTWTQIANSLEENANGCGRYFDNVTTTKALDAYLEGNRGTIYVRFSDAKPDDGFGCDLKNFSITATYARVKAEEPVETEEATITFVPTTADEAPYLHSESGSGNGGTHRWADGNAYYIYKFTFGKEILSATLNLTVQNDTKIEISLDGSTWTQVANSLEENANNCGRYFDNVTTTRDLDAYLEGNAGTIYVKFSDAKPDDGFGCDLKNFSITATYVKKAAAAVESAETTITFVPTTADEAPYLHAEQGSGNGGTHRWADNNAYYIYKFTLGEQINAATLNLTVQNDTKIEISLDGSTWTQIANSLEENANDCGRYFGNVTTTKVLDAYLEGNTGTIYVKFSDAKPDDGFGCDLHNFSITATYVKESEE